MTKLNICRHSVILGLFLMVILITSCNKLIQIPSVPPNQLSESQQFADSATAMAAVANVYTYGAYGNGFAFGTFNNGNIAQCTGLSSDELIATNSTDPNILSFYNYQLTATNSYVNPMWSSPYQSLYPVNAILKNINASNSLSTSFKTEITGEMEVVRAMYYFYLVNLFGPVPIVTSTDYKVNASLPRAPIDSVYAQIIADLKDAQQKLTPAYPSSGHLRPNVYTADALLAKAYLYLQQWQQAYDEANTVINSNMYSLEANLDSVFLDGSSEAIWQLPTGSNYTVAEASIFVPFYAPTPSFVLTPSLLNAFEPGDQRFQDWVGQTIVNSGSGNDTLYYPYKYKNVVPNGPTTEDYMIIRLAEVYLIRAEAATHLGNLNQALADLNMIRNRAGLPNSTASTQADILTAIMHERQVELFTEWGNRWFDLKRTGMASTVLSAIKTGWKANAALYPIPITQLAADPKLTQNPGY